MPRIGVLISGRGSNLQALMGGDGATAAAARDSRRDLEPRRTRPGSSVRETRGHRDAVLPHRDFASREAYDSRAGRGARARGVTLVCLAGFMRLLGPAFCDGVSGRRPEHPPVAAAGVSRRRRAAAGAGARRQGDAARRCIS